MLRVRHDQGSQDCYVPLHERALLLRQYWVTYRHAVWLFPARTLERIHTSICLCAHLSGSRSGEAVTLVEEATGNGTKTSYLVGG